MSMFVGTLALGELHLEKERHKRPDHFVHKHQDNTLALFGSSTPSRGGASPRFRGTESAPTRSPAEQSPGGSSSALAALGIHWRQSWGNRKDGGKSPGGSHMAERSKAHGDEEDGDGGDDTPGGPSRNSGEHGAASPDRRAPGGVEAPAPILQPTPSRPTPQTQPHASGSKLGAFLGALPSPRALPWTIPGSKSASLDADMRGGARAQTWSHASPPP
eukprot:CAMPEP_0174929998 /NCGR_PEP_ID=MMETSP1355-20121228/29763_1 /TAXON_ID=464990 /ORGANISM="Hemiselmis tepida, Strain CCMP443" /LENGTH=216 /DNA_ID=CAMNT_0016176255 /DNA_START=71 /DNA_END=718 /DNA_ORIENTATION=+